VTRETNVERKAFVMFIHPECHREYQQRHDEIWEEMKQTLSRYGVHNYSIHLFAEQHLLFGYAEIEDEARWAAIANTDICRKWWAYMKDVMPVNPDNSPVTQSLKEVFYLK
jgi:L-rhamnose mutarotase